jgi:hypothetical protein
MSIVEVIENAVPGLHLEGRIVRLDIKDAAK